LVSVNLITKRTRKTILIKQSSGDCNTILNVQFQDQQLLDINQMVVQHTFDLLKKVS